MRRECPTGFTWFQNTSSDQELLLPTPLVSRLVNSQKPKFNPEKLRWRHEIDSIVFSLVSCGLYSDWRQLKALITEFCHQATASAMSDSVLDNTFSKLEDLSVRVFDISAINALKSDASATRNVKAVLNRFNSLDSGYRFLQTLSDEFCTGLEGLKVTYPNCLEFLNFVEAFAMLAFRRRQPVFYFPPVILTGPPGVGKSAVVNALARLVQVNCRQVDLASTSTGMVLGGMTTQYADSKTGVVIDLLRDGKHANPIIILDEIDKANANNQVNPLGPLYTLLEPQAAVHFIDEALNLPSNTSHVIYVATANDVESLPKPILNRFTVLSVKPLTESQHAGVCQSIYRQLLEQLDCAAAFAGELSPAVTAVLLGETPRTIKSVLRQGIAQAARRTELKTRICLQIEDLALPRVGCRTPHYGGGDRFGFLASL